ncbi:IS5 family transposase [Aliifodinibius sp. S!AR15-10]|uniref:IS5 family transposase n=1 Tax=Aliifodinibius sp. S!AR15-10 TaxID=2950437 RepID=UPI002865F06B|nr:IS5 family transposase [Aliifodinibius sp. S!AR15-10]MDR8394681.1 IS5 family transposase [Aliifodinibius sp. S!AR15-10]
MSDKRHQLSILDQWASGSGQVSRSTKRLSEIAEWIDWAPLYEIGRRIDKTGPQGGQPRKPVRWMIRGLFLQHLYQLSDPQLEDQLIDRLSFRRFAGLPLDQKVPDFSTFWRFREALAAEGQLEELFGEVNRQLEAKGLILRRGTVVDATIIESTGRPLSDDERQSLEENPSAQIDTDGDSTQKGGTHYFGYKGHIGVDVGSKLIRKLSFTAASPHDSTQTEKLLAGDERAIFGDKAYPSKDLKIRCRQEGIYYGILEKAYRNTPLSASQKTRNHRHRRVRRQVEHPFAAMKGRYGMRWATAKTKLRNKARFIMSAICWNIERSISFAKQEPNSLPAAAT